MTIRQELSAFILRLIGGKYGPNAAVVVHTYDNGTILAVRTPTHYIETYDSGIVLLSARDNDAEWYCFYLNESQCTRVQRNARVYVFRPDCGINTII